MDLGNYEKILGAKTVGEAFVNDTINSVNNDFHNSPSYKKAIINGLEEELLLKFDDKDNKRKVFFRPLKVFSKGDYVEIDDKTFMIMDFVPNQIYPKAKITMCNNTLRWKDSVGSTIEYKCIVEGSGLNIDEISTLSNEKLITKSDAELSVYIPYNEDTKNIKAEQRFIFDESAYDVTGIDKLTNVADNQGIVKLTIKSTFTTDTDNVVDGVADDSGNSGWSGW